MVFGFDGFNGLDGFNGFNLHPKVNERLNALGFIKPTKIQEKAIPLVQEGKDVSGLAQTGTGKTAAFLIPILQRLYASLDPDQEIKGIKPYDSWTPRSTILILVPTRELAEQVSDNLSDLTPENEVSFATVYGGVPYEKQKKLLEQGATFVIATPGRLIDLYKDKFFDPTQVKCVVFDEADRMFDMGFKEDMKYLLDRIPRDRQFLVFSATLNFDVLTVAYEYGSDPVEIEIDRSLPKTDQVQDEILHVGHNEKPKFLMSLIESKNFEQAVVFTNFVRNVPKIEKFLQSNGFRALGISSAFSQSQRNKVMEEFRSRKANILVATDVAARGLDIENIDVVINFELPDDSENYVHRIGRTGRAGRKGLAFSLVSEKDVDSLKRIESFLETKLEIGWLEDSEIVEDFKAFPYTFDPHAKMKDLSGKRKDYKEAHGSKGKKSRERSREGSRERSREGFNNSYRDSSSKDSPKDSFRDSSKYSSKGSFRDSPKYSSKGSFRDSSKYSSKGSFRDSSKYSSKYSSKNSFKGKKDFRGDKNSFDQNSFDQKDQSQKKYSNKNKNNKNNNKIKSKNDLSKRSKRSESSKRYKDFKTVSKGSRSQKNRLISKIIGFFSK